MMIKEDEIRTWLEINLPRFSAGNPRVAQQVTRSFMHRWLVKEARLKRSDSKDGVRLVASTTISDILLLVLLILQLRKPKLFDLIFQDPTYLYYLHSFVTGKGITGSVANSEIYEFHDIGMPLTEINMIYENIGDTELTEMMEAIAGDLTNLRIDDVRAHITLGDFTNYARKESNWLDLVSGDPVKVKRGTDNSKSLATPGLEDYLERLLGELSSYEVTQNYPQSLIGNIERAIFAVGRIGNESNSIANNFFIEPNRVIPIQLKWRAFYALAYLGETGNVYAQNTLLDIVTGKVRCEFEIRRNATRILRFCNISLSQLESLYDNFSQKYDQIPVLKNALLDNLKKASWGEQLVKTILDKLPETPLKKLLLSVWPISLKEYLPKLAGNNVNTEILEMYAPFLFVKMSSYEAMEQNAKLIRAIVDIEFEDPRKLDNQLEETLNNVLKEFGQIQEEVYLKTGWHNNAWDIVISQILTSNAEKKWPLSLIGLVQVFDTFFIRLSTILIQQTDITKESFHRWPIREIVRLYYQLLRESKADQPISKRWHNALRGIEKNCIVMLDLLKKYNFEI